MVAPLPSPCRHRFPPGGLAAGLMLAGALVARPAAAILDIADRGPVLDAGAFAMRVTNAGILGNAFFDRGLSFDPSLEFPRGSGNECLKHAELWVGAMGGSGRARVSGGPMLEWRPTLDPEDRVRAVWAGAPGTRREVDDDGDGRVDEEILNGKDDDGDGLVDEDLGLFSQQMLSADYVDDRPEAVNYVYPTGESHEPLGLSVHQEAFAWSVPGYDRTAGIQLTIRNHGTRRLEQLYLGILADFDSRSRSDPRGHLDDRVEQAAFARSIGRGYTVPVIIGAEPVWRSCVTRIGRTVPVVVDGARGNGLPAVALLPLGHTIDPLAQMGLRQPGLPAGRTPAGESFRFSLFRLDLAPGQGGLPTLDGDRYAALAGTYPVAEQTLQGDWVVLLSAGPFARLEPGQSLDLAVAFVVGEDADSLPGPMGNAAVLYDGLRRNLLPDSVGGLADRWFVGETGINGHEVCLEAPPDPSFTFDPHCPDKFVTGSYRGVNTGNPVSQPPEPLSVRYEHGRCIWTDADCDGCTGNAGQETVLRWLDPGTVPPAPAYDATPGDHGVRIAWDDAPEILLRRGLAAPGWTFAGYRLYKLSNWKRESILPPAAQWDMLREFALDTLRGQDRLADVTDSTLASDGPLYGEPHHPVGRYRYTDAEVLNGFDYLYVVTTLAEKRVSVGGATLVEQLESPLVASIDSVVVPHLTARADLSQVWVVPNPYRAHAPWDRPPVPGDPFGRHVDFLGLPRAKSTIRIYTLAGDLVAQVDHDGTAGDGQAAWNLISRNGQDVESGIYLFTVGSALGHSIGRFVVIR